MCLKFMWIKVLCEIPFGGFLLILENEVTQERAKIGNFRKGKKITFVTKQKNRIFVQQK